MQEEEMIYEEEEVAVPDIEVIEVEMSEAFPATGEGDALNHATLNNREIADAHPIIAITGLRKELDTIKALQTVYSDKKGNADYYAWAGGLVHDAGYFVTLNKDTISICTGDDIFGVVVDDAAFIGGQDGITLDYVNGVVDHHGAARDMNYGLVATSGAVLVRCESDIVVGDYVVSNVKGEATRAVSGCGYQVVEIDRSHDTPYAMVVLTTSANKVDKMGAQIQDLDGRVNANYNNIISATNLAQDAYDKAVEAAGSASLSEEEVRKALESILTAEGNIEDFQKVIESSNAAANEAKQLAYAAVQDATNLRNETVKRADEDWKNINDLIDTLEPITSWEDPETGTKGADYLATQMNKGIATSYDVKTVDSKTDRAMSAVTRNGKELQSLMTVIDKYSVGPHSQAYGFTLEQAVSVLEDGMLYVPTEEITEEYLLTQEALEWIDEGKDNDKVYYTLSEGENGEIVKTYWYHDYSTNDWVSQLEYPRYQRKFTPEFLYQWGRLNGDGPYRWNTINIDYDPAEETNVSDKAVWFRHDTIPSVAEADNFGYWYTDGDTSNGGAKDYEKHTLYKWEKPEGEDGYWFAVATLAGNTQARVSSQIRQDANSIGLDVTNVKGDLASIKAWAGDDFTAIQDTVSWKNDNDEAIATTMQKASDSEAYISQVASVKNADGSVNAAASIVAAVVEDESAITLLADNIHIEASEIDLTGYVKMTDLSGTGTTEINGANIKTGTIDADKIDVDNLAAINADLGTLTAGTIDASKVTVTNLDANNITTGILDADRINVQDLIATGSIAVKSDVPTDEHITEITNTTISTTNVIAENLQINAANIKGSLTVGQLPDGVAQTDDIPDVSGFVNETGVTTIIGGTVTTDYIEGLNIEVSSAQIKDKLTADKIEVEDLSAFGANIAGWNISEYDISKDKVGIHSGDMRCVSDSTYPARFYAGVGSSPTVSHRKTDSKTVSVTFSSSSQTGSYTIPNCAYIYSVSVTTSASGGSGSAEITSTLPKGGGTFNYKYSGSSVSGTITFAYEYEEAWCDDAKFLVLKDGTMRAKGAILNACTLKGDTSSLVLSGQGVKIESTVLDANDSYYMSGAGGAYIRVPSTNSSIPHPMMFGITAADVNNSSTSTGTNGLYIQKSGAVTLHGNNGIYITADVGGMRISADGSLALISADSITLGASTQTNQTNYMYGTWKLNTSATVTSDNNLKHDIAPLDDNYANLFDNLQPVKFKYNDGTSDRYHTGFIAQDVCRATEKAGLTTDDFAAYVEFTNRDDNSTECGLRYEEFIALCVSEIQKLKKRVEELEEKLNTTI